MTVVEAATGRLLTRALGRIDTDEVGIVDSAPGNERMLEQAMSVADCFVIPTRVSIASGPDRDLAADGLDSSYRSVWRRALRSLRDA